MKEGMGNTHIVHKHNKKLILIKASSRVPIFTKQMDDEENVKGGH